MNDDTTADTSDKAVRWLIPILPAEDAVAGISHGFEIGAGPVPDDYREPVCGISAFIDQLCRTSTDNRCPNCLANLAGRQQK
jgi:hypothetical protein